MHAVFLDIINHIAEYWMFLSKMDNEMYNAGPTKLKGLYGLSSSHGPVMETKI